MKRLLFTALSFLPATPLMAHPGHEEAAAVVHWVSDGSHLAVVGLLGALACVVLGGVVAWRRRGRRMSE